MADANEQNRSLVYYIDKIRQGPSAKWEKDELLDVIHWWRQVIGFLFGLLWGATQITGFLGFISFLVLNSLSTIAVYKSMLGIDEDDYGGHADLVVEGMPGSVASFLLAWVLSYTAALT
eukprot:GHRR01008976.1.p1 GENE.GHRR01008976.1~~GHRR01008976.1.p1  ORF type:complete len:119 (+),score=27.50 GHRR01008976.1:201-557(+)